jgi:multicomponent Na+:H+ antiporter subunit B
MRRAIVIACGAIIAIVVGVALGRLPPLGDYGGPYGDAVVPVSLDLRHTSNVAGAVAYDIRGFDTLGEELILFAAVVGVAVLVRPRSGRHREPEGVDRAARASRSEGSRPVVARASAHVLALATVFGWYLTLHATQTPGGGFQGGAVLASALALVYLGGGYAAWSRLVREPIFDVAESAGVMLFVIVAAIPLAWGAALGFDWLPLGTTGQLGSGGTMFVINLGIAIAVAAGFAQIVGALLYELHEDVSALDQDHEPGGCA